jgi:hypothetical protein
MARISDRILAVISGQMISEPAGTNEAETSAYYLKHTPTTNGLIIEICFPQLAANG